METQPTVTSILTKPIVELAVSKEFLTMAKVNGFDTLQDVLDSPLHKLHSLPESGYRMVREFMNLLNAHGLQHLASR